MSSQVGTDSLAPSRHAAPAGPSSGANRGARRRGPGRLGTLAVVWGSRLALVAVVVGLWEFGVRGGTVDPFFFGQPSKIIEYFWQVVFVDRTALVDLGWSLGATLAAFGLGSVAAILVGLLFATYPLVERVLQPVLTGLNALPRIALAPLFLIWFGLGVGSKIALGCSLTFFIVLSSTVAGVRSVDPDLLTLSKTLGASSTQTFRKLTLPHAVPVVFSGLRLGLIYALLGVIASELIASEHGLGKTLSMLGNTFQTNGVFAILLLLAIVGGALSGVMSLIEARLLRWR